MSGMPKGLNTRELASKVALHLQSPEMRSFAEETIDALIAMGYTIAHFPMLAHNLKRERAAEAEVASRRRKS